MSPLCARGGQRSERQFVTGHEGRQPEIAGLRTKGLTTLMAANVQLDRFTISLLLTHPDAPHEDPAEAAALQDAHLAFLADPHAAGRQQVAGPIIGDPDGLLRGLSILRVDPDEARRLKEQDPAVQARRFAIKTLPWMVPAGAISFSPTRFPRLIKDVTG